MTPEQLKASILQYAIMGKLVEQREEGTAEELYQKIQAEKQKLIKEGKIKKEKALSKISEDEIPFDIPESWKWCYLSEIIDVRDGTHDSPKYVSQGIPLVTSKNLSNGTIDFENVKYITQEDADKINIRSSVDDNDILFAMIGSIGNPVLVKKERDFCIKNMALFKRYENTHIDMNYMYQFFRFIQYRLKMEAVGAVQSFVSLSKLRQYLFPLPPLEEQHRIVAKIEELLPLVDRYTKSYEKLEHFNAKFPEEMKKSILQYAIMGKLVEQREEEGIAEELYGQIQAEKQKLIKEGKIKKEKPMPKISEEEIPFDIPDSWKWVRWGDLSQSIQYGYNAPAAESGAIRMVRISDIQNEKVEWDTVPYCNIEQNEIEKYILKENDILFARTGGTVGKSYIVEDIPEDSIYAGYLIRSSYSEKLCPKYLKFFMGSQLYWNQLRDGVSAVAQPNCNGKKLAKMILPLPPLEEQHRIVAKIEELLPYCDRLSR